MKKCKFIKQENLLKHYKENCIYYYNYYKPTDSYDIYIINKDHMTYYLNTFDEKQFNIYFIDTQKERLLKLKKLYEITK